MPEPTIHFLLVYSFAEQRLIDQREYTDAVAATQAYTDAERAHRGDSDYEIVLVGSDSIETIMKTHGHYFRDASDSMFSDFLFLAS